MNAIGEMAKTLVLGGKSLGQPGLGERLLGKEKVSLGICRGEESL